VEAPALTAILTDILLEEGGFYFASADTLLEQGGFYLTCLNISSQTVSLLKLYSSL